MSHEFTAASRAASADELRATLSRLPVLRACALRSLGDAVCRREPAAPSIGPALLVLLEGLSSAAAAQHARSLLRRCCGALPALAEALAGDGALPRLPRLALLHALLEGGGAGWPAEAAEVLRALLRSPEVPCAAAHDLLLERGVGALQPLEGLLRALCAGAGNHGLRDQPRGRGRGHGLARDHRAG